MDAHRMENTVVVSVKDEGIGIPPESQEKVFDRFFRVNNTDCRPTGGAGLGLALTREIVKTHGGSVWVESAPDHGSTFYVSLPIATTVAT